MPDQRPPVGDGRSTARIFEPGPAGSRRPADGGALASASRSAGAPATAPAPDADATEIGYSTWTWWPGALPGQEPVPGPGEPGSARPQTREDGTGGSPAAGGPRPEEHAPAPGPAAPALPGSTQAGASPATAASPASGQQPASGLAGPAAAPGRPGWRAPGLDGVRALAVLAVLAFHEGLPWIPGGFLGVDVFFVLSGYLITDLLASKFARSGTVGLSTFWQRRARRLLPALALMLVTVSAAVTVLEPDQRAALRPALLGAVTYTSNWWQALAHQSYFDLYGPPPVLQHLWSLAVEEQFYLVWPLVLAVVLAALRRPVPRAMVAWAGAIASALAMYLIYVPGKDPSLVYYGTDTHASALMIGSALALTWPLAVVARAAGRTLAVLDAAGAAGALVLGVAMWHYAGSDPMLYPFGLVLAALAAGALVLAAAAPGRIGSALSWAPLRWLGIRSYGVYLWHWPVIAITVGIAERSSGSLTARAVDALLPVAIAAVSWRWLEEPVLRHGLRAELARRGRALVRAPAKVWRAPAAGLPVVTTLALVALATTAAYGIARPPSGPSLQRQIATGVQVSAQSQESAEPFPWWRRPGLLGYLVRHGRRGPRITGAKVIAIGDSVMLASAPELAQALPGIYINAQVSRAMIAGVAIVQQLARQGRLRPVLVVGLGTNGPITMGQIDQILAAIGPRRWLILVNTFVPRPWEQEVNSTIARAARRYFNVLMVNWHAAIEHHTSLLWSDGIHPQPPGGRLYARVVRAVVAMALRGRPRLPRRQPSIGHLLRGGEVRI